MVMGPTAQQGHDHISKVLYQGKQPGNVGWINGDKTPEVQEGCGTAAMDGPGEGDIRQLSRSCSTGAGGPAICLLQGEPRPGPGQETHQNSLDEGGRGARQVLGAGAAAVPRGQSASRALSRRGHSGDVCSQLTAVTMPSAGPQPPHTATMWHLPLHGHQRHPAAGKAAAAPCFPLPGPGQCAGREQDGTALLPHAGGP